MLRRFLLCHLFFFSIFYMLLFYSLSFSLFNSCFLHRSIIFLLYLFSRCSAFLLLFFFPILATAKKQKILKNDNITLVVALVVDFNKMTTHSHLCSAPERRLLFPYVDTHLKTASCPWLLFWWQLT